MALVYSYVRFSTRKQLAGDSLRRQVEEGEKWIAENGHTQASLTLRDLGVSAYKGRNHERDLGKFLEAVEGGQVPVGSILLVENLDRLDRRGAATALPFFQQILAKGVKIACLKPAPVVYDQASQNDLAGLMLPLIAFHLSWLESKNKADRIAAGWRHRREQARSRPGTLVDHFHPAWLDRRGDGFQPNHGAEAVRYIFEATTQGLGQRQITADLNRRFRPIGKSGKWTTAYVQAILRDRRVLGERQPYQMDDSGNRIPSGDPLSGYYPAVIDEPLWHRARGVIGARTKHKGPNSQFVNLFVGLVRNAHDGFPMHIQTTRPRGKVKRRLVSYAHLSGVEGADPVSVDYQDFEYVALRFLSRIDPARLEGVSPVHEIRAKEQERKGIADRIAELADELAQPGKGSVRSITEAIDKLQARLEVARRRDRRPIIPEAYGGVAAHTGLDPTS